ncbi:MAG: hypothetical protein WBY53_06270 [Acidobacteriaceae bacterium]
MAVVGGAALPFVLGLIARRSGSYAHAYIVVAAAYVVVALYGFFGSRIEGEPVVDVV